MADVLFDTTVLIDYYNGDPAAQSLVELVMAGEATASVSPVTTFEIWLGIEDHDEEVAFRALMNSLEPAPLTEEMARIAAVWLRGLSPRRAENLFRDALIATTASSRKETVVTRNIGDFQRFGIDVQPY